MKPTIKVNAESVVRGIEQMLDLTTNFIPLFNEVLGKENDRREWTLRGSVLKNFSTKRSPYGNEWKPLTRKYAIYKAKKFPGKPLMVRSGKLFNSLVRTSTDSVVIMERTKMTYGTKVGYGKYNMDTREFIGIGDKQKKALKKLLVAYVKGAQKGKKDAIDAIRRGVDVT